MLRSAPCGITYIAVKRTAKVIADFIQDGWQVAMIQICQWLCPDLYFRLNQPVGIAFSSVNNIYLIRLCIAEYIKAVS